jgi:hypothetical protein
MYHSIVKEVMEEVVAPEIIVEALEATSEVVDSQPGIVAEIQEVKAQKPEVEEVAQDSPQAEVQEEASTPVAFNDLAAQFDAKQSGMILSYNHRGEPIYIKAPTSSSSPKQDASDDIEEVAVEQEVAADAAATEEVVVLEQVAVLPSEEAEVKEEIEPLSVDIPEPVKELTLSKEFLNSPAANLNLSPHLRSVAEKKLVFQSPMKEESAPRTPMKCLGITLSCNHRGETIIVQTPYTPAKREVLEKKGSERFVASPIYSRLADMLILSVCSGLLELIKGNTAEQTMAYEKLKKVSAALESTAAIMYNSFRFQGNSSWKESLPGSTNKLLKFDEATTAAVERKMSMKSDSDIFALSRCGTGLEVNANDKPKALEKSEEMEDIADWISPVLQ